MRPAPFAYHTPATIDEAVSLLARYGDEARILAGGQSLVPAMTARLARPAHVIDINQVANAERPRVLSGRLRIPPLMRHVDCEALPVEGPLADLFATLSKAVGHWPVRLRGTVCGALAHGDPASVWVLAAVALNAEMMVRSQNRGVRTVHAALFFDGIVSTVLGDDELLVEVQIPLVPAGTRWGFHAITRRAGDYPLATALVLFDLRGEDAHNVRIAVGAVEETARRLPDVEARLAGRAVTAAAIKDVAEAAAATVEPAVEAAADAVWRRDLAAAAVTRALERTAL